jgi:hypothetical protein
MERDQERETRKLLNVLRRMARTARMSQFMGVKDQADAYSIDQYNRIAARLETLDPAASKGLFGALPPDASWSTLSNACRDLAAYYEDDSASSAQAGWSGVWTDARSGIWIDKSAFRHGMPPEVTELGHFIREKIAEWQERKGGKE